MATFLNHQRFMDYVSDKCGLAEKHTTIDRSASVNVLYGCPPWDVLVRVAAVCRWENGFAIFAVADETPKLKRDFSIELVHKFLVDSGRDDVVNYGIVSTFYLDDLNILEQLASKRERVA